MITLAAIYFLANLAFAGKDEASGIVGPFDGKAACENLRLQAEPNSAYRGVCLKLQDMPRGKR